MLFIKERKLKANHNSKMPDLEEAITECCLSKNANWKQITTMDVKQTHSSYWMLFIKERKLKANHNSFTSSEAFNNTECCLSKNANWKQITTYRVNSWCNCQLNVVYQRTQIESKSQLVNSNLASCDYWMLFIKERKLKANHNHQQHYPTKYLTECCLSKNANWKQITTPVLLCSRENQLNVVYQRTQIESKSQPSTFYYFYHRNWMLFIKERKLKANHNCS